MRFTHMGAVTLLLEMKLINSVNFVRIWSGLPMGCPNRHKNGRVRMHGPGGNRRLWFAYLPSIKAIS